MKRLLAVFLVCGLPNVALAGLLIQWDQYGQPGGGTSPATKPVAIGAWSADTQRKTVEWPAQSGRFVRFTALAEIKGRAWTSVAELQVFGTPQ